MQTVVLTQTAVQKKTPVAAAVATEFVLDQSDLSSVLRLLLQAIESKDMSQIEPLIGEQGTVVAPYAAGFEPLGSNNSDVIIPQLQNALRNAKLACLGYDYIPGALPDKGTIFLQGDVDWSSFPDQTGGPSNGIIFGFFKLEQKWQLMFVAQLPEYVLSEDRGYDCQPLNAAAPASLASLPALDRQEYFSVLQWIRYSFAENDPSAFDELVPGDLSRHVYATDISVPLKKSEFLSDLAEWLPGKPQCEYFLFDSSDPQALVIHTTGWSQVWEVKELCGSECSTIDPPLSGESMDLLMLMKDGGWELDTLAFGERPASWDEGLERIPCETISLSVGGIMGNSSLSSDPACRTTRPTRLQVGNYAFVSFYPDKWNNVRNDFGMTGTNVLTSIPPGTAVRIIDGPGCADDWVWWKIQVLSTGLEGWTSEGDQDAYWLVPCGSKEHCGTR